jgi:hypothetical protein
VREEDADALRIDINLQTPHASSGPTTVNQLIEHFLLKKMPQDDRERRSYSTKATYECYLTNWISPKWGKHRIGEIKAVAVENWLATIPRADGTKAKTRNIMSAVFNHAVRHEWLDKNRTDVCREKEGGFGLTALIEPLSNRFLGRQILVSPSNLAGTTGLEPATSAVTD